MEAEGFEGFEERPRARGKRSGNPEKLGGLGGRGRPFPEPLGRENRFEPSHREMQRERESGPPRPLCLLKEERAACLSHALQSWAEESGGKNK